MLASTVEAKARGRPALIPSSIDRTLPYQAHPIPNLYLLAISVLICNWIQKWFTLNGVLCTGYDDLYVRISKCFPLLMKVGSYVLAGVHHKRRLGGISTKIIDLDLHRIHCIGSISAADSLDCTEEVLPRLFTTLITSSKITNAV